jgi:hypothetical protein
MKNQYLLYAVLGLAFLAFGCQKDELKFEDVVLREEGSGGEEYYVGGWAGDEDGQFYADINYGISNGNLPDRVDLTPFLPPVASQGQYGTCVAWAVGYYTKTVLDAQDGNIPTQVLRDPVHQHSPKDLFWAIPNNKKGPNCDGTYFEYALDVLRDRGVADMSVAPYQNVGNCSSSPEAAWTANAANNVIENYREVPVGVNEIKERLAKGYPIMWAIHTSKAFADWRSSQPMTADYILDGTNLGGHAMTIVGYDDALQAFRIVNSWGTTWADNGFAWVDYDLMVNPAFTKYTFVAYNKAAEDNPVVEPHSGVDLMVNFKDDHDDPGEEIRRWRRLKFDVKNQGNEDVSVSDGWNNLYIYYNAYDANDYGVILHQHIDEWKGFPGELGIYAAGLAADPNANYWFSSGLDSGQELANTHSNGNNDNFNWKYYTPTITGQYYFALLIDAFDEVPESNESNNIYFTTGTNGRPITFVNGVGNNLQSAANTVEIRADEIDPNAYSPDEIRKFITGLKRNGKLKKMVDDAKAAPPTLVK